MCIAIGILLPMAIHSIPNGGKIFLPMHIPVLLCGFICGPFFGIICGVITPLLSFLLTGMPQSAVLIGMIVELMLYAFVGGTLYRTIKTKNKLLNIYISLIFAMIIGRLGGGFVNGIILNMKNYSLDIWIKASFVTAVPGIIIQLILIPTILKTLTFLKLIR